MTANAELSDYEKMIVAGDRAHLSKSPEELTQLAEMTSSLVLEQVAGNIHTPTEVLDRLVAHTHCSVKSVVRGAVYRNPNVSTRQLNHVLQNVGHSNLEDAVLNPKASPELLLALSKNRREWVRRAVVMAPNLPAEAKQRMTKDEDAVRELLVRRKDLDEETYWAFSKDEDPVILSRLAQNPGIPLQLMETLSNRIEAHIRESLLWNPNIPVSIILRLLKDNIEGVAITARDIFNMLTPEELATLQVKGEPETKVVTLPKAWLLKLAEADMLETV